MKISYLFVVINFLYLNVAVEGQEVGEWKLVKDSDNIKAFVMKSPTSETNKVKVETIIETTLSELVALMKDTENHRNWVFLNEEASLIEETDDFNWKYYGRSDAPWPVTDRDFITDITLQQNPIDYSVIISSFAIPGFLPENEDCIRVPYATSKWTFNPIGNGSIHITLVLEADIGGKIPKWFTNLLVTKGPLTTMNGLVNELKTNKYKDVKLDFIEEL
jgi:hypothetical protein